MIITTLRWRDLLVGYARLVASDAIIYQEYPENIRCVAVVYLLCIYLSFTDALSLYTFV